jgi:hypothetical protein
MKAVIFFSLGSSYTLPKTRYDGYADYRLASRGDLIPFWSFKLKVNKNKAVLFCPDTKNYT